MNSTHHSSSVASASPQIQELYKKALAARELSYSPYSGHQVGAAIRTNQGKIYTGCNVENSSFGATVCAERVAIQKAISETGKIQIQEIMVVTQATPPWPPCGMCRQVIAEFGPELSKLKDVKIHTANLEGVLNTYSWNDLIPHAFTPSHLST